jgi:error-prone DNA polymerase
LLLIPYYHLLCCYIAITSKRHNSKDTSPAGGTFLTLEDETGFVNVVVWQQVYAKHTALLRTATFLGVTGTMQVEEEVVHLVARTLWTPEVRLHGAHAQSRDFQ